MSSIAFDQLRDQLLRLPPDVIQTLRAALDLEPKDRQKLLDELPVLRQNLITIDIVDFLQPSATLYWYEGITILAVLLFQSITQRSMQFGF